MDAAIEVGPHISTLDSEAMEQLQLEVSEKKVKGQARVVLWDEVNDNPPMALKLSWVAMVPHKTRKPEQYLTCPTPSN